MRLNVGNWSIGKKLVVAEALLVLLLLSLFTFYVGTYSGNLLEESYLADMKRQVSLAKSIFDVFDHTVTESTEKFANIFISYFPGRFGIDPRRTIKTGAVDAPVLRNGKRPINNDYEAVDRFTKMTGAAAAVYVRKGDEFICITTSVKKQDGSRAIGLTLGKSNPGYGDLMRGESYIGRTSLFGRDYYAKYIPVKEANGEVVGILFAGVDTTEAFDFMKQQIRAIKIAGSGYIYALDADEGDRQGTLVIHPLEEGKNILNSKSIDGREFTKEMIRNREGVIRYYWMNKENGETTPREKTVVYSYFDKWKMLVAAGAYEEDVMADVFKLRHTLMGATILFVLIIVGVLYYATNRMVVQPLNKAVDFAGVVARGDLTTSLETRNRDEIGMLGEALNQMVYGLKEMVGMIKDTSLQLASTAGEISDGSAQLAKAANAQTSAADETSSTMVQMAASIQMVAGNADELASNAENVSSAIEELGASSDQVAKSAEVMASSVAETSTTIEQMTISVEKVAQNTEELSSSVSETSATIEQIAASIDKVADNAQALRKVVGDSATIVGQMAVSIRQAAGNIEEADVVAKTAAREGASGQQAVRQALSAMRKVADISEKSAVSIMNLDKRSEEIGNIVKVIKGIADQTNLLALNAAIEAARAGDAGKGFAVVAEEVRKLAERSLSATKEIGDVIRQVQADTEESVKYGELAAREAEASMELSGVADNSLSNIVKSIDQTSALMSDIARMMAEQADASTMVIEAVEKMHGATDVVADAARDQAAGGKQIRQAVDRMNDITREVTIATREQAQGSRQIRVAVENMNSVTGQVNIATREQALSARQIVQAANSMNAMTRQVANVTVEQKKGGEMIVTAAENINELSRENLASVEQLSRSAQNLSLQAEGLSELVSAFRLS
jgi:methyl-accepting chemotaxis protein